MAAAKSNWHGPGHVSNPFHQYSVKVLVQIESLIKQCLRTKNPKSSPRFKRVTVFCYLLWNCRGRRIPERGLLRLPTRLDKYRIDIATEKGKARTSEFLMHSSKVDKSKSTVSTYKNITMGHISSTSNTVPENNLTTGSVRRQ